MRRKLIAINSYIEHRQFTRKDNRKSSRLLVEIHLVPSLLVFEQGGRGSLKETFVERYFK
jgi:hypothetical protein